MQIESNKSLKEFNTFNIDVKAKSFVSVNSVETLKEALRNYATEDKFILGGGSNILLTSDLDVLVLHINLRGIKILEESEEEVVLEVQAGENWHEFVCYCLEAGYGGVENLSLIPGNVGTAPIQNIGAYGVELKDVFVRCEAIEIKTRQQRTFTKTDCKFGYRDSIFKNEAKGHYIITSVALKLTKKNHKLSTSYGAIRDELAKEGKTQPGIQDISRAVIAIRKSKLPDPSELGNSGSFFKNPVVSAEEFQQFRNKHPEAPYYEVSATEFKIPAGWLIEQAGFKGQRFGDAGVHEKQALVLVNYGEATGEQIRELAMTIQQKVRDLFGIYIEPEVTII
ncbi:MAG: UDP-N-acetylmuramate dehydrogenase [Flavobacteriaceae bacterium]|nr:UDP-N-acetylmuramate dehydrogenase [Flavobacteriaceae bacterium]